uniref:Uncharacterized protein n=1 Tax=Cannabis sativa TaxID=3483 RepID=A0A803R3P9_CANSA
MASSRVVLLRRMASMAPPANGIHGSSGEWHPSAPPLLSSAGILVISRCLYSICCRLSRSSSPHFSSKTEDPKKPSRRFLELVRGCISSSSMLSVLAHPWFVVSVCD